MQDLHIGFTGTRQGCSVLQTQMLAHLLSIVATSAFALDCRGLFLHHGDCIGADATAHTLGRALGYGIWLHPPTDARYRAHSTPAYRTESTEDYLTRNRAIVAHTSILIACPAQAEEQPRGGTWFTVRRARDFYRPTYIIAPDGSVVTENAPASLIAAP